MLFMLTGNIQIGKTRWLQRLAGKLEDSGVAPCGVIAPGTWVEHRGELGGTTYEKTGINNELLPTHEIVPFARRADLAVQEHAYDENSQAAKSKLGWAISDEAIERVNDHFANIARLRSQGLISAFGEGASKAFLIVDEFGRLELHAGGGLTHAVELVDQGADKVFPHALIVVRKQLLDDAERRFARAPWGEIRPISPDDAGESAIFGALGI